jgi:hypothetical protein
VITTSNAFPDAALLTDVLISLNATRSVAPMLIAKRLAAVVRDHVRMRSSARGIKLQVIPVMGIRNVFLTFVSICFVRSDLLCSLFGFGS